MSDVGMRWLKTEWVWALVLLIAGVAAYSNSFQGVFVQDDETAIVENPLIRTFPSMDIFRDNRRPLLYLSLAMNYRAGGVDPWGYHLVNLLIHVMSALVLFAVILRTLRQRPQEAIAASAVWTAGGTALLWMAHPLQTADRKSVV